MQIIKTKKKIIQNHANQENNKINKNNFIQRINIRQKNNRIRVKSFDELNLAGNDKQIQFV